MCYRIYVFVYITLCNVKMDVDRIQSEYRILLQCLHSDYMIGCVYNGINSSMALHGTYLRTLFSNVVNHVRIPIHETARLYVPLPTENIPELRNFCSSGSVRRLSEYALFDVRGFYMLWNAIRERDSPDILRRVRSGVEGEFRRYESDVWDLSSCWLVEFLRHCEVWSDSKGSQYNIDMDVTNSLSRVNEVSSLPVPFVPVEVGRRAERLARYLPVFDDLHEYGLLLQSIRIADGRSHQVRQVLDTVACACLIVARDTPLLRNRWTGDRSTALFSVEFYKILSYDYDLADEVIRTLKENRRMHLMFETIHCDLKHEFSNSVTRVLDFSHIPVSE